jgi:hypothetical protein
MFGHAGFLSASEQSLGELLEHPFFAYPILGFFGAVITTPFAICSFPPNDRLPKNAYAMRSASSMQEITYAHFCSPIVPL